MSSQHEEQISFLNQIFKQNENKSLLYGNIKYAWKNFCIVQNLRNNLRMYCFEHPLIFKKNCLNAECIEKYMSRGNMDEVLNDDVFLKYIEENRQFFAIDNEDMELKYRVYTYTV